MQNGPDAHDRTALSLMRAEGRLERWNEARGFGFVTSSQSGAEFFVHVSAFPRDGRRPQPGESLSFAIETTAAGRKQAIDVRRPTLANERSAVVRPHHRPRRSHGSRVFGLLVIGLVVAVGVFHIRTRPSHPVEIPEATRVDVPARGVLQAVATPQTWQCAGRQHCSQMTSCAEATWVLQNCPGTTMDGDNDGVPCESQWCSHP